jgi:hypothetical protein
MTPNNEKSVGIRVSSEVYDKINELCINLGGIPINNFAANSIQAAIEMLEAKKPIMPKWIEIQRFHLSTINSPHTPLE